LEKSIARSNTPSQPSTAESKAFSSHKSAWKSFSLSAAPGNDSRGPTFASFSECKYYSGSVQGITVTKFEFELDNYKSTLINTKTITTRIKIYDIGKYVNL